MAPKRGSGRVTTPLTPFFWQVVVNYSSGAARAEEVVAQVKAAGGQAIAVGGSVGKVGTLPRLFSNACNRADPTVSGLDPLSARM